MAATPGRAGGVFHRRRKFFSDSRSLDSAVRVNVSAFPIPPSRPAIRAEVRGGAAASLPETDRKPLPPDAMTFSSSISTEIPILESSEVHLMILYPYLRLLLIPRFAIRFRPPSMTTSTICRGSSVRCSPTDVGAGN